MQKCVCMHMFVLFKQFSANQFDDAFVLYTYTKHNTHIGIWRTKVDVWTSFECLKKHTRTHWQTHQTPEYRALERAARPKQQQGINKNHYLCYCTTVSI